MVTEKNLGLKKERLTNYLENLDSLLVAFSGGVDSTFLLEVAHQALGKRVLAATAFSLAYPSREREEAVRIAEERGIEQVIFHSDEITLPEFVSNGPDRCYHCKRHLFSGLKEIAGERGISYIAHAANLDDLGDFRPGLKAAQEMGILAPLIDVELGKEEIRVLSKEMGLPTWNKPATACLASRIPYGHPITNEKLKMVEQAEEFLANKDFTQFRVRHHGPVARVEVDPSEIKRVIEPGFRKEIVDRYKEIGFLHIAVDMEGYTMGSLNRGIKNI